jgi:hypothetical protein
MIKGNRELGVTVKCQISEIRSQGKKGKGKREWQWEAEER